MTFVKGAQPEKKHTKPLKITKKKTFIFLHKQILALDETIFLEKKNSIYEYNIFCLIFFIKKKKGLVLKTICGL
ncbi:hypothetical protein A7K93_07025 [Candidatus Methylacidiphilum fumarolicum]|nr:hypothetical protein A7K73_02260 [Candidatus Methylacidiphilum fumarolicum]TFE72732.1 hypothetical protein A7K72_08185 [Candidatus Methylacidiphilum fumarolicum]TFE73197.1 hypothetical protein A7K93_07025 [Candidatus Methylacidiphilum fumarolicum]TFE77604.1 hypothetical protein A7D33_04330 [Candidatus Methylacidiphilum fumarolicum]